MKTILILVFALFAQYASAENLQYLNLEFVDGFSKPGHPYSTCKISYRKWMQDASLHVNVESNDRSYFSIFSGNTIPAVPEEGFHEGFEATVNDMSFVYSQGVLTGNLTLIDKNGVEIFYELRITADPFLVDITRIEDSKYLLSQIHSETNVKPYEQFVCSIIPMS